MIVVALVAACGIGLGIGIAMTHRALDSKVSSARNAQQRAQKTADLLERQVEISNSLAMRNKEEAVVSERNAELRTKRFLQQATWMRACDDLYSAAQQSTLRLDCIDAARSGVSSEIFQRQHPA